MKKLSIILLIFGLIFSQIVIFRFNLNNGFEFHGFSIKFIPLAAYAGKYSPTVQLETTILGYIFYIIFGVLHTNKIKFPQIFKPALMFSGIAIIVTFFEFTSILEDLNGTYTGKYFRIGWLIFILGLFIFSKKYFTKK